MDRATSPQQGTKQVIITANIFSIQKAYENNLQKMTNLVTHYTALFLADPQQEKKKRAEKRRSPTPEEDESEDDEPVSGQSRSNSEKTSTRYTIPRKNTLLDLDSEEESLGYDRVQHYDTKLSCGR